MQNTADHQAAPEKKPRKVTDLPASIRIVRADGETENLRFLDSLSLAELADYQSEWKATIAAMPNKELELRAINAEIRKRAR